MLWLLSSTVSVKHSFILHFLTQSTTAAKVSHPRKVDALRAHFKKLKNVRKPTGDPDCPSPVRRAKRIYRQMERRMSVVDADDDDEGPLVSASDNEDEDDDEQRAVQRRSRQAVDLRQRLPRTRLHKEAKDQCQRVCLLHQPRRSAALSRRECVRVVAREGQQQRKSRAAQTRDGQKSCVVAVKVDPPPCVRRKKNH